MQLKKLQHAQQRADLLELVQTIPERYAGDIRLFEWHNKRLTQETVKAVHDYIETYKLSSNDYFVGRVSRWEHYESAQIKEGAITSSFAVC